MDPQRIFGGRLRGHVLSGTGLTIGVGFGATKHWPNRRSGRQRNGHNSVKCCCRPKIHAERQNYSAYSRWKKSGAWEPDSEKAARYGDHHRPAAVADEPYIYLEKLQRSAGAHGT